MGLSASDPKFSVFQELGSLGNKPRETLYFLTECVGWRRQSCGTMSNLEVHHREFRSHARADSVENHLHYICIPISVVAGFMGVIATS